MTVTATPVSSTDAFLANYVAIEERRANFEEKLANQQLRKDTMEYIKTFGNLLTNPHIDAATKASVASHWLPCLPLPLGS